MDYYQELKMVVIVGDHGYDGGGRTVRARTQNGVVVSVEVCFAREGKGRFVEVLDKGMEPTSMPHGEVPGEDHWAPGPLVRHPEFNGWVMLLNRSVDNVIGWLTDKDAVLFESWTHREQVIQLNEFHSNKNIRQVKGMIETPKDRIAKKAKEDAEAERVSKLTPEEQAAEQAEKEAKKQKAIAEQIASLDAESLRFTSTLNCCSSSGVSFPPPSQFGPLRLPFRRFTLARSSCRPVRCWRLPGR